MNGTYHNITISGLPGCGSTTLLELLKKTLDSDWKGFSGGEFFRQYSIEQGLFDPATNKFHHDATIYGEELDRKVDYQMRQQLSTEHHWILESWLSGFLAQGVPHVLKVLLTCSDDAVRIDRIVNRDDVGVDEAKKHIHERTAKNLGKWTRLYEKEWNDWVVGAGRAKAGEPIDFWHPALYDVVIDTYSKSREETLETVLKALRQKAE